MLNKSANKNVNDKDNPTIITIASAAATTIIGTTVTNQLAESPIPETSLSMITQPSLLSTQTNSSQLNQSQSQSSNQLQQRIKSLDGHEYICTNKLLGHGSFSRVYGGYACAYTPVAIKKIPMIEAEKEKNKKYLKSEISIMTKLKNDNIVNLLDVIWEENDLYLVLERCGGGDFKKYLNGQVMREPYAQFFMRQLANGLKYLHENNISHRDLKPQNLLLTEDYKILKISDFGFAKIVGSDALQQTICGSPMYMAPEIMEHLPYTDKSDLWSVGIIMYEIMFGRYPVPAKDIFGLMKALQAFSKVNFPQTPVISKESKHLISALLTKQVDIRISWDNFFIHPWFSLSLSKSKKDAPTVANSNVNVEGKKQSVASVTSVTSKSTLLGSVGSIVEAEKDSLLFNFEECEEKPPTNFFGLSSVEQYSPETKPVTALQMKPSKPQPIQSSLKSSKKTQAIQVPLQPQKTSGSGRVNEIRGGGTNKKYVHSCSVPSSLPSSLPSSIPLKGDTRETREMRDTTMKGIDKNRQKIRESDKNRERDTNREREREREKKQFEQMIMSGSPNTNDNASLHINSTSPFAKSFGPSINFVEDYSSTDVFPADPRFKHNSAPPPINNDTMEDDRNTVSMIGLKGKNIDEKDEEKKLTKTMKEYAVASLHLLRDSFNSFNGLN